MRPNRWVLLFPPRLLRRLATLLSQQATMIASNEAFKKQAEGASDAAKRYMEENEKLQEVRMWGLEVTLLAERCFQNSLHLFHYLVFSRTLLNSFKSSRRLQ